MIPSHVESNGPWIVVTGLSHYDNEPEVRIVSLRS